jgi:hypothetical protein
MKNAPVIRMQHYSYFPSSDKMHLPKTWKKEFSFLWKALFWLALVREANSQNLASN